MKKKAKGSRISGTERQILAAEYAASYNAGESIRSLATASGRSYGFVQRLLREAGVQLRGRGGPRDAENQDAQESAAKPASTTSSTSKDAQTEQPTTIEYPQTSASEKGGEDISQTDHGAITHGGITVIGGKKKTSSKDGDAESSKNGADTSGKKKKKKNKKDKKKKKSDNKKDAEKGSKSSSKASKKKSKTDKGDKTSKGKGKKSGKSKKSGKKKKN